MSHDRNSRIGVAYGIAAYFAWGFIALYFKAVAHVAPFEVLAHRIVWSLVLLLLVMGARGRLGLIVKALRNAKTAAPLACTTCVPPALARSAKALMTGRCGTSLALLPSGAGTCCSASKYSRHESGTLPGLAR